MKRIVAGLALCGLVLTGMPTAATATAAAAAAPTPVDVVGADLVSVALDEADRLSLRLRTADRRVHDPASVVLPGTSGVTGRVPDHPAYAFMGRPAHPVWVLAAADREFPAWDTSGVPAGRLAGGELRLELSDVEGPGEFHAYTMSPVGEPRLLLGTSGQAPRQAAVPAGQRLGGVLWVFDAAGSYHVTLAASAQLTSGVVVSDRATYQVEVPALPASAPQLGPPRQAGNSPAAPAPLARQDPSPTDAESGEGKVVIGDGHVDIGPRFVGDAWTIQVKDDTTSPAVWRHLHDVVLQVVDEAIIEIPDSADFGFLGQPGDEVWLLPQAQQAGILWPGWNTEHESVVSRISGDTSWRLRNVSGPGEFVLFLTGSFGQSEILFDSQQELPQDLSIPLRTHAHGNWAFTQPGVYHLTLEISATTSSGESVRDERVLAFAVGDRTDPATAFPPPGGGSGNGDDDGDDDGVGALGQTGRNLIAILGVGAVLLLAGVGLVLVTMRRRAARSTGEPA